MMAPQIHLIAMKAADMGEALEPTLDLTIFFATTRTFDHDILLKPRPGVARCFEPLDLRLFVDTPVSPSPWTRAKRSSSTPPASIERSQCEAP